MVRFGKYTVMTSRDLAKIQDQIRKHVEMAFSTRNSIAVLSLGLLLVACDSGSKPEPVVINSASLTEIKLPEVLRTVSALDPGELQLSVRVNDQATDLAQTEEDLWTGSVNVPGNQTSSVVVEWGTSYGSTSYLKLAEQQKFIYVAQEARSVTFDNSYNTNFDTDNDSRSNLAELEQGRSPVNSLDVFIEAEGSFVSGGIENVPSSECGSQIPIVVKTRVPMPGASLDHQAWWCAKLKTELTDADGNVLPLQNIEITVNVKDTQLFDDSGALRRYEDDSVEIFIDGNNNKGGTYDGVNDFQFRFAPTSVGDEILLAKGPANYQRVNLSGSIEYITGGYVLTAIIPLDEVGITNAQPFGLNIGVNDDDDGLGRDGKFSWIGTEGSDVSFRNPSAFGTAQVPEIR